MRLLDLVPIYITEMYPVVQLYITPWSRQLKHCISTYRGVSTRSQSQKTGHDRSVFTLAYPCGRLRFPLVLYKFIWKSGTFTCSHVLATGSRRPEPAAQSCGDIMAPIFKLTAQPGPAHGPGRHKCTPCASLRPPDGA